MQIAAAVGRSTTISIRFAIPRLDGDHGGEDAHQASDHNDHLINDTPWAVGDEIEVDRRRVDEYQRHAECGAEERNDVTEAVDLGDGDKREHLITDG